MNVRRKAKQGSSRAKQLVGYVGTAGIYFGFSFASLILFISLVLNHAYHLGPWTVAVRVLSLVWCLVYVAVFGVVSWYLLSHASRESREGILLPDVLPKVDYIPAPKIAPETEAASSPQAPIAAGEATAQVVTSTQPAFPESPQSAPSSVV
jgi:hypothetical protein